MHNRWKTRCLTLAVFLLLASDTFSASKALSRSELSAQCDQGKVESCAELGEMWFSGRNGPKDLEKALKLFRKACDAHVSEGCAKWLATVYLLDGGQAFEFPDTPAKKGARIVLRKICADGFTEGCSLLGSMWLEGYGGPKDVIKGRKILMKACDDGDEIGCSGYAMALNAGEGGKQDQKKAREIFKNQCMNGSAESCTFWGSMLDKGEGGPRDRGKARQVFKKGCEESSGSACYNLGSMWLDGIGGKKDREKAKKYYNRACETDDALGCMQAATILYSEALRNSDAETLKQCRTLYKKACDGFEYRACANLGAMLMLGEGGEKDQNGGQEYLKKACDHGYQKACKN